MTRKSCIQRLGEQAPETQRARVLSAERSALNAKTATTATARPRKARRRVEVPQESDPVSDRKSIRESGSLSRTTAVWSFRAEGPWGGVVVSVATRDRRSLERGGAMCSLLRGPLGWIRVQAVRVTKPLNRHDGPSYGNF